MKHITFPDTQPSDADNSQRFSMGHHPTEPSKLRLVDLGTRPDKLLAGIQGIHHKLLSKLFVFGNPTSTWPRILWNFASRKAFFCSAKSGSGFWMLGMKGMTSTSTLAASYCHQFLKDIKFQVNFGQKVDNQVHIHFFASCKCVWNSNSTNECKLKTSAGS